MTISRTIIKDLTYNDIIQVALTAPNKRAAAEMLGVNDKYFLLRINELGMAHWFPKKKLRFRFRILDRDDLLSVSGLIRRDAAEALGVSYSTIKQAITRLNMEDYFPTGGQTIQIVKRGYAK